MHTQVMEINPALAEAWLKKNTFNRKMSAKIVRKYADDMDNGRWTLNHQGIAFDDKDVLVDGQHRLAAVIECGKPIEFMVTWGASRVGIDELRVRTAHDVIQFGGLSEWLLPKDVQVAKQMMLLFSIRSAHSTVSTSQLVEFSEKNKSAIQFAGSLFHTNTKGVSSAACRATIAVAYYHIDHERLREFVECLYSGVVSNKDESAAIRAREQIIDNGFAGGSAERVKMVKRLARAIVAFEKMQPLGRLMTPSEYPFTLPEGMQ